MLKILVTDELSAQGMLLLSQAEGVQVDVKKGLSQDELATVIAPYHGLIIRSSVKVTAAVLKNAENLQVVGRAGVGVDNVDLEAASLRGIIVMNTPGANSMATAEHTIAMLLAMCRNIPQAYHDMLDLKWNRKQFVGTQLYEKTIGIVGLGRIGSRVALRCRAFGMRVLAYDPYIGVEAARELKVTLVDLDELFAQSDFISLHTALTPDTKNIINAEAILQMKDGVRLVNCARGALVDEYALADAVKSGKVAGVALDVFSAEPMPVDSPLRGLEGVIFTPHLAASTIEAQRDVGTQVVSQVLNALSGDDIRNAVNMPLVDPKVMQTMRPFLSLAETVGSLQTQLADGGINRIELEFKGDLNRQVKLLTVALLKGILSPMLEERVNYINAPHLANRRGIRVSETTGFAVRNYPNLMTCRVYWAGGSRLISATIFHTDEPRIVQIDNYRMDVRPAGKILVLDSHDVPGLLGKAGSILGEAGINIAAMRFGRTEPGGETLTFIKVDSSVPASVLETLLAYPPVKRVWQVSLN